MTGDKDSNRLRYFLVLFSHLDSPPLKEITPKKLKLYHSNLCFTRLFWKWSHRAAAAWQSSTSNKFVLQVMILLFKCLGPRSSFPAISDSERTKQQH